MNRSLLLKQEKQQLHKRICQVTGRERELIDLLLSNYPKPSEIDDICQQLNISQNNLLYSLLRNARIFIDIETLYQSHNKRQPTHLTMGKQMVASIRCQCLLDCCCDSVE